MTEVLQHADHQMCQGVRPDAQCLPAQPAGIRQLAEHVEDRPDTELTAGGTSVAHRRMEGGREAEAHAGDVDTPTDAVPVERAVHPQRPQPGSAPAPGPRRAGAVLRYPGTPARPAPSTARGENVR